MPQPLDPAIQELLARMARPPLTVTDPSLSLVERARAFRARDVTPPQPPAFAGTIEDCTIPVRWGNLPGRIYRPDNAGDHAPAVAFFHGGGFIAGNLDSHEGLCRELASASYAVVLSVDYRLAPEWPFPAGLEDAYDATAWLATTGDLAIDSHRIAVAGDSAGANLATGVTMLARAQGAPSIGFQLLFYPKLDFVNEYPSHIENRAPGIPPQISEFFDDCYLPEHDQRAEPLASPALATDLAGLPPGLMISADADTLRDEAEAYGHALRLAGVDFAIVRAIGQPHGFASMTEDVPSARLITRAAASLMGDALRRMA